MQLTGDRYDDIVRNFNWAIPARFSIAQAISDRHAASAPHSPALIYVGADDAVRIWTHGEINAQANRLAHALAGLGVARGDVVGVHLPQSPECLIAHIAILKCGGIVLPLFRLFGPDALRYRLADSSAKVLFTRNSDWQRIRDDVRTLEGLEQVVTVGQASRPTLSFWQLVQSACDRPVTADMAAGDPALLIYTSGTTGQPKGVLHAQRVLIGHLPGVAMHHDRFPVAGDRMWTPADWAWIGGLLDVLWPALYWRVPVVGTARETFDPDWAFAMMAAQGVRNVFMPPTALRLMRQGTKPADHDFQLRSIGSGGETLGPDLIAWGRDVFGVTINEFYGQTECNLVVGNCASAFPVKPGSMGRATPGHRVGIVDDDGCEVEAGVAGIVAVRRPDPVMFLEYWNRPEATSQKFRGEWCLLGDIATRDAEGYFWFQGRDDDIINASGYRIGPGEIEACLATHPAVKLAGVVGIPDPIKGEAIAAFVTLKPGIDGSDALAEEIRMHVRTRLAKHEAPRHITFIETMPMTVTGKIKRKDLRDLAGADGTPVGEGTDG